MQKSVFNKFVDAGGLIKLAIELSVDLFVRIAMSGPLG
jgi:hypothetical protein